MLLIATYYLGAGLSNVTDHCVSQSSPIHSSIQSICVTQSRGAQGLVFCRLKLPEFFKTFYPFSQNTSRNMGYIIMFFTIALDFEVRVLPIRSRPYIHMGREHASREKNYSW